MLILILIDLFYVIPQRRVPYRLRCYLMTKNLNVAAIDSAQFGTWLVSHLWGGVCSTLSKILSSRFCQRQLTNTAFEWAYQPKREAALDAADIW